MVFSNVCFSHVLEMNRLIIKAIFSYEDTDDDNGYRGKAMAKTPLIAKLVLTDSHLLIVNES